MSKKENSKESSRRDFLHVSSGITVAVGACYASWPLIDQMNPSADVLAVSSIEVDLSSLEPGQSMSVLWRGKPLFIRCRTEKEIKEAQTLDVKGLKHPESDGERVKDPRYLVMIGVCTHLGCVPLGQQGDYGGWFCPCHGSHYDTSGRIRKGPAPSNLEIPPYEFITDSKIKIG